jgi:hypothetical protein
MKADDDSYAVALNLHLRVQAQSWDSLGLALSQLHQPRRGDRWLTCQGCDRCDRESGYAAWPCRTYILIAAAMLRMQDTELLSLLGSA